MSVLKKCTVCGVRPRQVPDREAMGRPIKKICYECHAARLRGDIANVGKGYRGERGELGEEKGISDPES